MLAIGVKESTRFNSVFTGLNLMVVLFVVIAGSFKIDFSNWNVPEEQVPAGQGSGGFFPFGFSGMMAGESYFNYFSIINFVFCINSRLFIHFSGAATCFYGKFSN
jgi:amino acid transporter